MVKYLANYSIKPKLEKVDVKEIDNYTYKIGDMFWDIKSKDYCFCDAFDEAKAWLLNEATFRYKKALREVDYASDDLDSVKAMEETSE